MAKESSSSWGAKILSSMWHGTFFAFYSNNLAQFFYLQHWLNLSNSHPNVLETP